jgi:hypothetical protein
MYYVVGQELFSGFKTKSYEIPSCLYSTNTTTVAPFFPLVVHSGYLVAKYSVSSAEPSSTLRFFPRPLQLFHLLKFPKNITPTISTKSFAVEPVIETKGIC